VAIYTPKEAHSRIFVTGGSFFAPQWCPKQKLFLGRQQGVTIRNTYYTYFVLSIRIIHYTRDGQIWYTRGNIIIHLYIYKKTASRARWIGVGIRLITDHVAPCSCRLLLETAPARLLLALEARPLLQRTRRTRPSCTI